MAEYTSNINLEKPSGNENFRRQVINDNMDKVDKKFGIGAEEGHTHDGTAGQGKKISYNSLTDKPAAAVPMAHKSTHAFGGTDALTCGDIGAATQVNFSEHLADYTLQVPYGGFTTGSANTYAISTPAITALTAGMAVAVKFNADSTGASTLNWNGKGAKGIKKSNGTDVTNLKAIGIYTLRYDGTNFILQGEGGSGDATAPDLLSGKKAATDAGDITGSMPNNGSVGTQNLTTQNAEYTIPAGYHNGLGKVKAVVSGLIAGVIKAGTTVGGILGTFTSDATATASQILSDITAYVNGTKVTGIMPDRRGVNSAAQEAVTYGDGRLYVRPLGGCWDGIYWTYYDDLDFINTNFLDNKNIFGLQGAIPVMSTKNPDGLGAGRSEALAVSAASYTLFVKPKQGYYNGIDDWTHVTGMGFDSNNWPAGVSVLGVAGTMPNRGTPTLNPGDSIPYGYYGGGNVSTTGYVRYASGMLHGTAGQPYPPYSIPSAGFIPKVCVLYLVSKDSPMPRTDGYLANMLAVGINDPTWNSAFRMVAEDCRNGDIYDIPYQNGMAFNADGSITITYTVKVGVVSDVYYKIFG